MKDLVSIVAEIKELNWHRLGAPELQMLMVLSYFAAREFAGSLRIAMSTDSAGTFLEMAQGELMTGNLHFEDYDQVGDHADFLWHFIQKHGILAKVPQEVRESVGAYLQAVECLPRAVRVMSIVSRERELSGIFERILEAPDWSLPGLAAFRYYLEEHIKLDSNEGGHADLLAGCEVDERVVEFYERRLDLYRCMPTLFTKRAMQKLGEVQVLG